MRDSQALKRSATGYREEAPRYEELRDWDIVAVHGNVRLIGTASTHVDGCVKQIWGSKCQCFDRGPRLSSPVVDEYNRPLQEGRDRYDPPTGEAQHLLDAGPGTEVPVKSGKMYLLVGPRKVEGHDSYALMSIFYLYPQWEEKRRPWWARIFRFSHRGVKSKRA